MSVIDPAADPTGFTAAPPTGITLCQQLGRVWAERSTLAWTDEGDPAVGLSFAEPSSTAKANIYAIPMPDLGKRKVLAASIVCDGVQRLAVNDAGSQFNVSIECHADEPPDAVALGADLVRHLLKGRGWWNEPVTRDGEDIQGAVGFPAVAANAQVGLWRIQTVQLAGGPRHVPLPPPAGNTTRTPRGQAMAVVQLIITALPLQWQEPD